MHGTPLDPGVWTDVVPFLSEHQPVHAPDVTPRAADRLPQLAIAERLVGELAAVADRWDVVGHSFGGQIAIELALLAPERVATLAVICSRDTPFPPFAQTATELRAGVPVDVDGALARWFRPDERQSSDGLVTHARQCLMHADRATWAAALDGIASYDRAELMGRIQVPTLLICAALDTVSAPAAMTALAQRLPNSDLQVLPDAAHLSPLLHPRSLADRLTRHQTSRPTTQ